MRWLVSNFKAKWANLQSENHHLRVYLQCTRGIRQFERHSGLPDNEGLSHDPPGPWLTRSIWSILRVLLLVILCVNLVSIEFQLIDRDSVKATADVHYPASIPHSRGTDHRTLRRELIQSSFVARFSLLILSSFNLPDTNRKRQRWSTTNRSTRTEKAATTHLHHHLVNHKWQGKSGEAADLRDAKNKAERQEKITHPTVWPPSFLVGWSLGDIKFTITGGCLFTGRSIRIYAILLGNGITYKKNET